MQLWFETHATSIDNERSVASGHGDPPLSALGQVQAAELGARYVARQPATVYTSDLQRAVVTAEIAFAYRGVPRCADARLRECDYGSWSGCPLQQLKEARLGFVDVAFPGGESFRGVVQRVSAFLEDLRQDDGPVLLIAHRAPWYALEHLLRGRDLYEVVDAAWEWQPGWEYEVERF